LVGLCEADEHADQRQRRAQVHEAHREPDARRLLDRWRYGSGGGGRRLVGRPPERRRRRALGALVAGRPGRRCGHAALLRSGRAAGGLALRSAVRTGGTGRGGAAARTAPGVAQQAAPRCPGTPGWLDEIDPRPGPPCLAMGLRALAPGRWLTVDDPAALAANRAVLAAHPEDVVAVTGGPEHDLLAAARELAALVGEAVGAPVAADGDDPASLLVAAARPVAEDLCCS